ncbi:MAG: sigma-70 family RNA polymerase sigma factor [Phycisphaerae bacterium]|nr:sigma-70 family RNA polymerase sigma factor [Phycisphaerae bacterium]
MVTELTVLVKLAQHGDTAAYEEIVLGFQGMAVAYAYSLLSDFHLAEDATQEAFLDGFAKLGDLRRPEAFPGWFRRILFKHCDRIIRRGRARPEPISETTDVSSHGPLPGDAVEAREVSRGIEAAMSELTEKERTALALFYVDGCTQDEIAAFLGVSGAVVRSRLHRARKRLKARLLTMVEDEMRSHAPDDAFAERVAKAAEVYASTGPAKDLMSSEWTERRARQTAEILAAGEAGFRLDVELSRSPSAKLRAEAALHFGLRGDDRGRAHLVRMLSDESWKVRRAAIVWFAAAIHPEANVGFWGIARPADSVPDGIDRLLAMLNDEHPKVRQETLRALAAYAHLDDAQIDAAIHKTLDDRKHKVRHAAARLLELACPGCGATPPELST